MAGQEQNLEDSLFLLIEIIQNYEFLYNLKDKDYKNNKKKEQAWKEISTIVNMNVEECTRHWKNLRDRFTREKRQQPSGSEACESQWTFFDKMLFYNKFTRPRQTHTSTPKGQSKIDSRPSSSCSSSAWSTIDYILSPSAMSNEGEDIDMDAEERNVECIDADENVLSRKEGTKDSRVKSRNEKLYQKKKTPHRLPLKEKKLMKT